MSRSSMNPYEAVTYPAVRPNGSTIKNLRRARKLTQLRLASLSDVSERTIRNAEGDLSIRISSLEAIAAALAVPFEDLVYDPSEFKVAEASTRRIHRLIEALSGVVVEESAKPLLDVGHNDLLLRVFAPAELPFAGDFVGESGARRWDDIARLYLFNEPFPVVFDEFKESGELVVVRGYEIRRSLDGEREHRNHFQYLVEYHEDRIAKIEVSSDPTWYVERWRQGLLGSPQ